MIAGGRAKLDPWPQALDRCRVEPQHGVAKRCRGDGAVALLSPIAMRAQTEAIVAPGRATGQR